ncbi:MAG: amidohydrolase [Bryobacteraceae bacterium]
MGHTLRLAVAALACTGLFAAEPHAEVKALAAAERDTLAALYRELHANPELSFQEKATAVRVARELRAAGFEVTEGVGGHGVVGVMRNGEGPTVLVRTDLDGLPVVEKTGLPYASQVRARDDQGNEVGVMHACGHDVHMTVFAGTARILNKLKDRWKGTLVMIGQPAEERGSGARAMLKDGLYTRFPRPDFCLALHTDAALEAGKIGYRDGFVMANVDSVEITMRGVGGHGAYPQFTKDPIVMSAELILALQTVVSREVAPISPAVVTVGSIHGGTKHNIIPDEVALQLTVRSYTDETREMILAAIRRIAKGTAVTNGVPPDREPVVTQRETEYTPATYNDPELAERMARRWRSIFGDSNVVVREPEMGGEDFSRYGRQDPKIPSLFFRIGTVDAGRMEEARRTNTPLPSLHSSQYWPAIHPTLETGVAAMTAAVLDLLAPRAD